MSVQKHKCTEGNEVNLYGLLFFVLTIIAWIRMLGDMLVSVTELIVALINRFNS